MLEFVWQIHGLKPEENDKESKRKQTNMLNRLFIIIQEPFDMQNNRYLYYPGYQDLKTNEQNLIVFNSVGQETNSPKTNLNKNFNKLQSFYLIFL